MTRKGGEQGPSAEGDVPGSPLERLKGSVREYHEPLEPVSDDDWEALGNDDNTATPRGDA